MSKFTFTAAAAADLSSFQYHIMRLSAANTVNVASQDTNSGMVGVLLNKPESGEAASIQYAGMGKVYAGAAITAGAILTNNGSGRAVAAGSGDMACARALEAAGAAGDIIDAVIFPPVRWAGAI